MLFDAVFGEFAAIVASHHFVVLLLCLPFGSWHRVLVSNKSTSTDTDNQNAQSNKESLDTVQPQTDALDTLNHLTFIVLIHTSPTDNLSHSSATGAFAVVWRDTLTFMVTTFFTEAHWLIAFVLTRVFIGPTFFAFTGFAFAADLVASFATQALSAEFRAVVAPVACFGAFCGFWCFGACGRDGGGQ